MIHTLLPLTRPLVIPDTETTSLHTGEARIVELGYQVYTSEGLQKEWRTRVDPQVPISAETTAIHGITDEDFLVCRTCGGVPPTILGPVCVCTRFLPWPTFREIAPELAAEWTDVDFGGKNIRYDLRVVAAEMQRHGIEWSYAGARVIDADRLEQIGDPRTLAALYKKHTGKTLDDAHQALNDVRATAELLVAQLLAYPVLPRSIEALHAACWPNWIDPEGKFRFVNGVPTCGFGKHNGTAMSKIPTSYWDWMLLQNFSEDLKTIARAAKLGQFPEQK